MAAGLDAAIELIISGRPRPVGNVTVARLIPVALRRHLGPFVFLDHMGPVAFPAGSGFDVAPHPHIGLSTVTYLFEGEVMHRDSLGSAQLVTPGALNLMTAGKGIVHSERSEASWRSTGGTMHGAQLWLGLPLAHEEGEPIFAHHPADSFPIVESSGIRARILFGAAFGQTSPALHPANPLLAEVQLEPGATLELPASTPSSERGLFLIEGELQLGETVLRPNQLLVFKPSLPIQVQANQKSRALLLGGPVLDGGERFIDWNFVSSSKVKIAQARADWIARRFPPVPGDEVEFILLHANQ
jgi:redox-sensitive bicupin YhaK (pirin superfamily)